MINEQLLDYVRQQLGRGVAKEAIREMLMSSGGWIASDVDAALAAAAVSPDIGAPAFGAAGDATKYAGFWIRAVAFCVDGAILAIPSGALMMMNMSRLFSLIGQMATTAARQNDPATIFQNNAGIFSQYIFTIIGISLASLAMYACYFVLFTYYKGATPGKILVGIAVRSDDLSRLSFGKVLLRETAGRLVSQMVMYIGYIMVAFTEKKKGLHDMISGSVVIYKDPRNPNTAGIIIGIVIMIAFPIAWSMVSSTIAATVVIPNIQKIVGSIQDNAVRSYLAEIKNSIDELASPSESKVAFPSYAPASDCSAGVFASVDVAEHLAAITRMKLVPTCLATKHSYAVSVPLKDSIVSHCIDSTVGAMEDGEAVMDKGKAVCAPAENR